MNKRILKGGIVGAIATVVLAVVAFILAVVDVFEVNAFLLLLAVLSYGLGLTFLVYGLVVKGGYESAVGLVLIAVGLVVTLIMASVKWYVILIIALAFLLVAGLSLLLFKSDFLVVKRAEEEQGYKPYDEVLKEKKANREKEKQEAEEIKLKDYSNKD